MTRHTADQVAVRLPLVALRSETISILTDHFQQLFMTCYGEEKKRRELAAARLRAALDGVDLFPLVDANHEDHRPE